MVEDVSIRAVAQSLVDALNNTGKTVAIAESCTGGWIAKAITDIPGSSSAFAYGIVCYSNGAKESLLGVQHPTLAANGAVSEAVVVEMAEGVMQLSGADFAVAVSGIAGPDGGSDEKPVGTVWLAWARRTGSKITTSNATQCFAGDRVDVRVQAVAHALQGLLDEVQA